MVRTSAEAGEIKGGGLIEKGGNYCMVEDCSEVSSDYGVQVKMEYVCLASTNPDNVGRKRSEFLDVTGPHQWKWWEFAVAVGLATKEEYEAFKKSGGERDFNEQEAVGRLFCCEHREETWTAKSGANAGQKKSDFQYGHRIWAVDDPRAKDIPKEEKTFGAYMAAKQRALAAKGQQLAANAPAGGAPAAGHGSANGGANGNGNGHGNGHGNGNASPPSAPVAPAGGDEEDDWGKY